MAIEVEQMIMKMSTILLTVALAILPARAADLSGRWATGGKNTFVLRQVGNTVTGTIEGAPGDPTYKVVDGVIRGNQIQFFVLHEDPADPEVRDNEGKPFHNLFVGTFSEDEITGGGSRENTTIRTYKLVLKRIKSASK